MFKFALSLSLCMIFGACTASNQEPGEDSPPIQALWSGDADPNGSYAAEVARFTQDCQDGSSQIVTVSGSEVHVDVAQEASAPLRLYTLTATVVDAGGARVYAFEKSGVRSDGSFQVWKAAVGEYGRVYVEMSGKFEISDDGATRFAGRLVKNTLEYPVPGHLCTNVYQFGSP